MEKEIIREVEEAVPNMIRIGRQMHIDYDKEADVLYVSFEKPQDADDSIMEGDIIYHKRKGELVGLSILHASRYKKR